MPARVFHATIGGRTRQKKKGVGRRRRRRKKIVYTRTLESGSASDRQPAIKPFEEAVRALYAQGSPRSERALEKSPGFHLAARSRRSSWNLSYFITTGLINLAGEKERDFPLALLCSRACNYIQIDERAEKQRADRQN